MSICSKNSKKLKVPKIILYVRGGMTSTISGKQGGGLTPIKGIQNKGTAFICAPQNLIKQQFG